MNRIKALNSSENVLCVFRPPRGVLRRVPFIEMREIVSVVPGLFFIVVPSMAKVINNYNRGGVSQSEPPEFFFTFNCIFLMHDLSRHETED
jgi:hypothetical protein